MPFIASSVRAWRRIGMGVPRLLILGVVGRICFIRRRGEGVCLIMVDVLLLGSGGGGLEWEEECFHGGLLEGQSSELCRYGMKGLCTSKQLSLYLLPGLLGRAKPCLVAELVSSAAASALPAVGATSSLNLSEPISSGDPISILLTTSTPASRATATAFARELAYNMRSLIFEEAGQQYMKMTEAEEG